jgi:hypothetical protein
MPSALAWFLCLVRGVTSSNPIWSLIVKLCGNGAESLLGTMLAEKFSEQEYESTI